MKIRREVEIATNIYLGIASCIDQSSILTDHGAVIDLTF